MTIPKFATKYMPFICPKCSYGRSWSLRREKKKCKRCRSEWSTKKYPVQGCRSSENEWRKCIQIFLTERTIRSIVRETKLSHCQVEKMVHHMRIVMIEDYPALFVGTTEMDETYVGGQRKNKRLHIRRIQGKRGHGTEKLPIVGLFNRTSGQVYVEVLTKKLDIQRIFGIIQERVNLGSTIYTDGFKMYRGLPLRGYPHFFVDHDGGEYVRDAIHTNNIEGFWGILKRKLGCIGGMRRERLPFFVAEIVWKFNHRNQSLQEQENALFELLTTHKFGG